jgi:hypothetical protein
MTAVLATNQLTVRIADITLALSSDDPDLPIGAAGAIESFLTTASPPDTHILVTRAESGEPPRDSAAAPLFDSRAVWRLSDEDGGYRFRFTSRLLGSHPYKVASFSKDFSHGTIALNRSIFPAGQTVYPLEYPLDELILLNLLARGRGVEVHACGLMDAGGNGSLFLGQSGAGKTTTAKIWETVPGITILSDDRIILRKIGDTIWMYGTPWHGEGRLSHPGQAPLRHIYFLRHGTANELILQSTCDAITRLFACSFPLFHSAEALDFTLSFFDEVASRVPAYELRFLPDARVLDLLPHSVPN